MIAHLQQEKIDLQNKLDESTLSAKKSVKKARAQARNSRERAKRLKRKLDQFEYKSAQQIQS